MYFSLIPLSLSFDVIHTMITSIVRSRLIFIDLLAHLTPLELFIFLAPLVGATQHTICVAASFRGNFMNTYTPIEQPATVVVHHFCLLFDCPSRCRSSSLPTRPSCASIAASSFSSPLMRITVVLLAY